MLHRILPTPPKTKTTKNSQHVHQFSIYVFLKPHPSLLYLLTSQHYHKLLKPLPHSPKAIQNKSHLSSLSSVYVCFCELQGMYCGDVLISYTCISKCMFTECRQDVRSNRLYNISTLSIIHWWTKCKIHTNSSRSYHFDIQF